MALFNYHKTLAPADIRMDATRSPSEGKDSSIRSDIRLATSDEPRTRCNRRTHHVPTPTTSRTVGWIGILGNGLCKSETKVEAVVPPTPLSSSIDSML